MTITLIAGPSWLSLSPDGRLTGIAPSAGSYSATLQSTVGASTATKAITVIANSLGTVSQVRTATQLEISKLVLSFSASVGDSFSSSIDLTLLFTAKYQPKAVLPVSLSFTASVASGPLIPTPGQPDYNEPNNASSQATVLTNGQLSYNTMPAGDPRDWFKITKATAGPVTLTFSNMTQLGGSLDGMFVDVYDLADDTSSIWDSYVDSSVLTVTSPSLPAGTYLIRLVVASDPYESYNLVVSW